jgi:hypothetical protein
MVVRRGSFGSAVLASLLASPIEWAGYFALLYLVVAIQSPRFSARWLIGLCYAPTLLYVGADRPVWTIVLGIAGAFYVCMFDRRPQLTLLSRTSRIRADAPESVSVGL